MYLQMINLTKVYSKSNQTAKQLFFFLNIRKEIGKAWGKSLTHAKRARGVWTVLQSKIKLIKHTTTCLGYEFCFQQHDIVTRQSYFFKPLSTYLRLNKNPVCFCFFFFFKSGPIFLWCLFNGCFILKKGQYFKGNIFLSFIKPYERQVFPHEKEVKVLLLTSKLKFACQLYSSS